MELCEKLKQIRKENNLTQQQLADELCLSRTVITKYERGHRVPNLDTLILISNYFKTSIFDEYKDKFKLLLLSIKCIIPYLISLIILLCSSLTLVTNTIKINNQYGYNIYNDEMKVEYCDEICIVNIVMDIKNNENEYKKHAVTLINLKNIADKSNNRKYFVMVDMPLANGYYLLFINKMTNDYKYNEKEINIFHKPFIYPLKDYDEYLQYDEQTGECSKIINYYID